MPEGLQTIAYIAASVLFIYSLRGLSSQATARRGNAFGAIGMGVAVLITAGALMWPSPDGEQAAQAAGPSLGSLGMLLAALVPGCAIGALLAARVAMTAMPQLVAILHSFVGRAAVLVGIATYLSPGEAAAEGAGHVVHLAEIFVGVFVGAITFTGSIIAWGKLQAVIGSRPLLLPGRHLLNLAVVLGCTALGVLFGMAPGTEGMIFLLIMTGAAGLLGCHLVMAIGGGDMPVVVSLLNSYSGWAAWRPASCFQPIC